MKASSRRLQDVLRRLSKHFQDVLQRFLQDIFKTYHQVQLFLLKRPLNVFEMYSTRFWDVLRRRLSTERSAYATILRNLQSRSKISNSEFLGYTETFKTVFLKHSMKSLLPQTKMLMLKSGIRKNDAVSVNIELILNKSSSKNVFLRL